jgi:hypothetical protein
VSSPWDDPFARFASEPAEHGREERPRGPSAFAGMTIREELSARMRDFQQRVEIDMQLEMPRQRVQRFLDALFVDQV